MFEIGNSLRAARERQGLGYPEIELGTKIRAKYIRALEEEDFDALPGDAYIRGFLRTYADYLGLDGEVYVEEYASRFFTTWHGDDLAPRRDRRHVRRRERGVEWRAVLLVLAGIGVVTALVFVAARYAATSSNTPAPRHSRHAHQQRPAPARQLVLHGIGRGTYVEVRRGRRAGEILLQGTVGAGEVDKLAGRRFFLLVRSPARVHVTLDGRAVSLPAGPNLRVLVTPQRTTRLHG